MQREPSEQVTRHRTYGELLEQHQRRLRKAHIARLDDLDQQDRQHVGHRVVTPALEFEQRAQVLFQAQAARAQDRKDRCRIGRGHHRGQQQRFGEREARDAGQYARDAVDQSAGEQCGEHDAQRGEDDTGHRDRFDFGIFGIHAARKQDDAEGDHADELCGRRAVELDPEAVAAEKHAYPEEQQ